MMMIIIILIIIIIIIIINYYFQSLFYNKNDPRQRAKTWIVYINVYITGHWNLKKNINLRNKNKTHKTHKKQKHHTHTSTLIHIIITDIHTDIHTDRQRSRARMCMCVCARARACRRILLLGISAGRPQLKHTDPQQGKTLSFEEGIFISTNL